MKVETPVLPKNREPIPSALLQAVKHRSIVKVAIDGEQFWVIVFSRRGDRFMGVVNNDLGAKSLMGDILKLGRLIAFDDEHILDISPNMVPKECSSVASSSECLSKRGDCPKFP